MAITLEAIKDAAARAGIELTEFVGPTYGINGLETTFQSKIQVNDDPFCANCSVAIWGDVASFIVMQSFFKDPIYHFRTVDEVVKAFQLYRDLVMGAGGVGSTEPLMKCIEEKRDVPDSVEWNELRTHFVGYREDLAEAKLQAEAKDKEEDGDRRPVEEEDREVGPVDYEEGQYVDDEEEPELDEDDLDEQYERFSSYRGGPDDLYQ